MRLKFKLALFSMVSKIAVSLLFLMVLPYIIERINLRQIDYELIRKREQVIDLIVQIGIEPFISSDTNDAFGSYNILKEEFVSIERIDHTGVVNHIEVSKRLIEEEEIDYRVLHYSLIIDDEPFLLEVGKSIESILVAKKNITRVIIFFIILIVVITLIADLQFTNILLRPLDKITGKLKKNTAPGNFDRVPVRTSTTDFIQLDRTLTDQMAQIEELFSKEKEITINISHELMTPISIIRSKLENLLVRDDIDDAIVLKVEESLKTLHRLQGLVNSLLTIARIESSQYLKNEAVSPGEVIAEVIAEIDPVAEDKGISLINNCPADHLFQNANKELLFSMFFNVIYNGVKNTDQGGRVTILEETANGRYRIIVADTGRGLTETQMENLFLRFKARSTRYQDGTGIGLAITKAIAEFHGINISVTSTEGSGTNFLFDFPKNS
ncbi:MAG: HAMP domain-containing sensor histidine kinase [Bacteroidales bacterium]